MSAIDSLLKGFNELLDVVFFESHDGGNICCNPRAIFFADFSSNVHSKLPCVFVISNKTAFFDFYSSQRDSIFVEYLSGEYWRYLSSSKYIICNGALPESFVRRPGQMYLNTWHGTPIKRLGADVPGALLEHQNGSRNFLQATHLISPNAHTTQALAGAYGFGGIFAGLVAETGYPRVDLTLGATPLQKAALKQALGLAEDERIVLYAPTWRGSLAQAQAPDAESLRHDLDAMSRCGATLLFRAHHMVEAMLPSAFDRVRVVPQSIDTNELLSIVDVLITDYSSITFDFLATGRPIVHYLYDLEAYEATQGLYLQPAELPGAVCLDVAEVVAEVRALVLAKAFIPDKAYLGAQARFCPHDDGQATQRVVDFFFHDDRSHVVSVATERKKLLFFAGQLMTNGVTTSFLNLANGLDLEQVQPVLLVDRDGITNHEANIGNLRELRGEVTVLGRCGPMQLSAEEADLLAWFESRHGVCEGAMTEALERIYQREWRRLFGDTVFDLVVNFEGYSPHWAALFAFAPRANAANKAIYLHNDMQRERLERFPYLAAVRNLYAHYDKLVSVGEWVGHLNRLHLAGSEPELAPEKFIEVSNPIRVDHILERAAAPMPPELALFMGAEPCFLGIGRLSPEKDHAKLLKAFAIVLEHGVAARLVIAGDGPLWFSLRALAAQLGMAERVAFLGNVANPYPILKAAACLVLSSNYEGQPMVLREAMALGKPVIATNIGACREVLGGGAGHLVENSAAGLSAGMLKYLQGGVASKKMNSKVYERHALNMFYEKVVY